MDQQYFVLELAHPVHGQVKRVQISYTFLCYVFGSLAVATLLFLGAFSSYLQMSWKVSHYNRVSADLDHLRARYQELQRVSRQNNDQMATLQTLASEVSIAYGFNQPSSARDGDKPLLSDPAQPSVKESIEEYNFLRVASYSSIYHRYLSRPQIHIEPSLWPLNGALTSTFGARLDPFSGEGAFHTGVDISARTGTAVHATADGLVSMANWSGRYGKLVVVDHGKGIQTYYAHLSEFMVLPGQEVRLGQVIGLSGGTGHATSPHLHYEVRLGGTPVNPYKYLAKAQLFLPTQPDQGGLGL